MDENFLKEKIWRNCLLIEIIFPEYSSFIDEGGQVLHIDNLKIIYMFLKIICAATKMRGSSL